MVVVDWFRSHVRVPHGTVAGNQPCGGLSVDLRLRSQSVPSARRALLVALGSLALLSLGAAQAGAASLPNGRAYEQVSPPDKNGQDVAHTNVCGARLEAGSSTSGDAIVYAASSAFPGGSANTLGPQYLSLREPPSWSTLSLAPPASPVVSVQCSAVHQLAEDRSRAVVRSGAVLAPGGWGSEQLFLGFALYLRDLSDDSYQTVTPAPFPGGAGGSTGPTPYDSVFIGASADVGHVLFETFARFPFPGFGFSAAELTEDAVPLSDVDPKLYKWSNGGPPTLESKLPNGTPVTGSAGGAASGDLAENAFSSDGSRLFFTRIASSSANNGRLFVRENGTTTQIAPPGAAVFRGATPDGDHVFFTTGGGLFRYDVESDPPGATTLLSVDDEPDDGTSTSALGVLGFSDDGSRVYFAANGQRVEGAEPDCEPPAPVCSGGTKLYLWEDGVVKFIASVDTSLTNANAWGTGATPPPFQFRYVGRDGAGLVLRTEESLTGYDNSSPDCVEGGDAASEPCAEVFLYDAGDSTRVSPDLVCVSCDPSGAPPSGHANEPELAAAARYVSDGAERAYFHSPDALVPEDVNGRRDVYMWEDGELHLISTGTSASDSSFVDASPSGDDLFFVTRERLVGWDRDDARDLYDARVGGGLPEPPAAPLACSGDPCQGPPSGGPAPAELGSSFLRGLGDLRPGARPSFRVRRLSRAQRARLARGGRVVLPVRVNRAGRLSVAARARMGGRMRVVARASKRARRAGTVGVPLRLSKPARAALARRGRLGVRVAVRFSRVREAKTLTLRLRRAAAPAGGKGR